MPTKRKYFNIKRRKSRTSSSSSRKVLKLNLGTAKKRERFRIIPDNLTLSQVKMKVLEMQMNLAVAVRDANHALINHLIKKMIRSDICRTWAVYKTISSSGSKSTGIGDQMPPRTNEQYKQLY